MTKNPSNYIQVAHSFKSSDPRHLQALSKEAFLLLVVVLVAALHENILDKQKPYFGGKSQEELSLRVGQGWGGKGAGQLAGEEPGWGFSRSMRKLIKTKTGPKLKHHNCLTFVAAGQEV